MTPFTVSVTALLVMLLIMLAELQRSRSNEAVLRERGAVRARDGAYSAMKWVYPGTFVAMAVEGTVFGPVPGVTTVLGIAIMVAAKALKYWAIASLGARWSYGVYVLPGEPLVASGPYVWMRHPNYAAVVGELAGMALIVGARITGVLSLLVFVLLLRLRIADEERALGIH
jgi:methyltransferase